MKAKRGPGALAVALWCLGCWDYEGQRGLGGLHWMRGRVSIVPERCLGKGKGGVQASMVEVNIFPIFRILSTIMMSDLVRALIIPGSWL